MPPYPKENNNNHGFFWASNYRANSNNTLLEQPLFFNYHIL